MQPFHEILPAGACEEGRVPLLYRTMTTVAAESASPAMPMAESAHHRARGYLCIPYHKSISRCIAPEAGRAV